MTSLAVLLALLLVCLVWLLGWRGRARETEADARPDTETRAAEDEVQELDSFTTPDQAEEELRDWGPGTP